MTLVSIPGLFFIVICILIPVTLLVRLIMAVFSTKLRADIWEIRLFHYLWFLASVACIYLLLFVLFPSSPGGIQVSKEAKTNSEINQIQTAIQAYQTEYSTPPDGKTNAEVIKDLIAGNRRAITFLSLRPEDQDSKGEVLDAWGTPLQIILIEGKNPIIKSAGPDKNWGTPDDMDNGEDSP